MLVQALTALYAILFLCSIFVPKIKLQPTSFALYGITGLMMWPVVYSIIQFNHNQIANQNPAQTVLVLMVVFLLVLILGLGMYKLIVDPHKVRYKRRLGYFMFFFLAIFVIVTIFRYIINYGIVTAPLFKIHLTLLCYFLILLLCYFLMNLFIDFWSKIGFGTIIVILGSQLDDMGRVTKILENRLKKALKIYQRQKLKTYQNPFVIVTGGRKTKRLYSEAEQMANYLIRKGIDSKSIIIEDQATNTFENFVHVKELIQLHQLEGQVIVVTSRFHLVRSEFIARQADVRAFFEGVKTPIYLWPFSIIREFVAYLFLSSEHNFIWMLILIIQVILGFW